MILKRRQASLSLIEQAYWISEESPETADRFIDAAAASFSFLESNPEIGREYEATNERLADTITILPGEPGPCACESRSSSSPSPTSSLSSTRSPHWSATACSPRSLA